MNEWDNVRLTKAGCRERVGALLERLGSECQAVIASDPRHIGYLSGFFSNPATIHLRSQSFLVIEPDGRLTLITDGGQAEAARQAQADQVEIFTCYDESAPRRENQSEAVRALAQVLGQLHLAPRSLGVESTALSSRARESLQALYPAAEFREIGDVLLDMRRRKWADEVECMKRAIRACEAGYAAGRADLRPGMTEVDLYSTAFTAALREAGEPITAVGDFISGPQRTAAAAGPPTRRVIGDGELVIMDFFILLGGYRADLCNTFVAGGQPTAEQQTRFAVLQKALAAAEELLRPGTPTLTLYRRIEQIVAEAGLPGAFWGHAGHGLGLDHPEAPFLVQGSEERLEAGNVLTVEPGIYLDGWGGMRIEDNYLITAGGFERLSRHEKRL